MVPRTVTRWERVSGVWAVIGPLILIGWWAGLDWFLIVLLWLAGAVWTLGALLPEDD